MATNGFQHDGQVRNGIPKGARLIETAGIRDQTIAADATVGRLQPAYSAKCRGLSNRPACIGTNRYWRKTGSYDCSRPTAASTTRARMIPRILGRTSRARFGRSSHRELVEVRFPEDDHVRPVQSFDYVGIKG